MKSVRQKNQNQNHLNSRNLQKQKVNIQENSHFYFQIGLILCLLGAYTLFELEFSQTVVPPQEMQLDQDIDEVAVRYVKQTKKEIPEFKKELIVSKLPADVKEIQESFEETIEDLIISEPLPVLSESTDNAINLIEEDDPIEVPFIAVEHVPVFPGCENEKDNDSRKKCMSEKIAKFVNKKFDTELASSFGLNGRQRITVFFKIDKDGNIINIGARAPHPGLENEAKRVIQLLPKMQPGRQRGKSVIVPYSLPILFQVQD